jgi:DUF1009 family protein
VTAALPKIGIIAGGGDLPPALAQHCKDIGRDYHVFRLRGFADQPIDAFPGDVVGIAEVGRLIGLLKATGCGRLCFAGYVKRPDLSALKPDFKGLAIIPGAIAAARHGDDALMRYMMSVFEAEGFGIEGAEEVRGDLTLGLGPLGAVRANASHDRDIEKAVTVARAIGALDIGQGAIVVDGLVLAVEAQEGTDAMLDRCAALPGDVRGTPMARRGVLAKCAKPIQELRVDLPTIGLATVERAAAAGLAGIVGEAGRMLVMDRSETVQAADRLGVFIIGIAPPQI